MCISWVAEGFSFIKQDHLFPDSHWFPKIEPEFNSALTTKDGDLHLVHTFPLHVDVSARGEVGFLLPLHIYSFYPKQDEHWKQIRGHLGGIFL